MKGGLFLTSGLVATVTGARTVDDYSGLADRFSTGAVAFGVLAFAMVGVPPAIGFVGKWYIALGAVEAGQWPLAVAILGSTLLTLAYFARVIERMFFRDPAVDTAGDATPTGAPLVTDGEGADAGPPRVSAGMRATVLLAAVLAVVLGVAAFEFGQVLEPTIERLLA
jgi:multicomponent Na+:H+ antiporter subunit D